MPDVSRNTLHHTKTHPTCPTNVDGTKQASDSHTLPSPAPATSLACLAHLQHLRLPSPLISGWCFHLRRR